MGVKFNQSFFSKIGNVGKSGAVLKEATVASEAEALSKATEAGEQLAQCVINAISSSGMNGGAIAAVGDVASTGATKVGEGVYQVGVTIGSEFRPSLVPEKYGGINDMAALLNNGYHAGNYVVGEWHGNIIRSLTDREGAHFVQAGASDFMGSYGGPGHIVSLTISDRFQ